MLLLVEIKTLLISKVKFQETPIPLVDSDYLAFTVEGAQRLYVDAGLVSWTTDYNQSLSQLNRDFDLIQKEYIFVASQIAFFNQIKNYWTTLISYTTNAISIAGASNVFKTINGNVIDLESRLSQLAWKFSHRSV